MNETDTIALIDQPLAHKLEYTRKFLKDKEFPHTGTRLQLRKRIIDLITEHQLFHEQIQALLDPLQMWGKQRVRIGQLDLALVEQFTDRDAVRPHAQKVGMGELLGKDLPLVLSQTVEPLTIDYHEENGKRTLTLVSGWMKEGWQQASDLPEITVEDLPDVVYRPFKRELVKSLSFAEIDLDTGDVLLSSRLQRQQSGYVVDFEGLETCFAPFLSLSCIQKRNLCTAIRRIYSESEHDKVRVYAQDVRGVQGGKAKIVSIGNQTDIRTLPDLHNAVKSFPADALQDACNCIWFAKDGLQEVVITSIYGDSGEISFYRQMTEDSVRHVLRRVQEYC